MSALLGYGWLDRTAYWAWVAGMAMGGFLGVMLGQWMVWLTLRNPLASALRAYRELWRGSEHLAGAFIESAPWITAGATPSQRADLCAVSVATEEAARHL